MRTEEREMSQEAREGFRTKERGLAPISSVELRVTAREGSWVASPHSGVAKVGALASPPF